MSRTSDGRIRLARSLHLAKDGVDYVLGKRGYRMLCASFIRDRGDIWRPDGTRVELADASIVGRGYAVSDQRHGLAPAASIPILTVRSGLPHAPGMLETKSIRWKWYCAQLTGRCARPFEQKTTPVRAAFG
jgi:hypothetical protein